MSSTSLAVRLYPEALRTLAFGSVSGTYAGLGAAFLNPSRVIYIVNTTDVLLTFSFDGVADHFVVASNTNMILDVTSNRSDLGGAFSISQGTRIYVKGSPTLGSVYL